MSGKPILIATDLTARCDRPIQRGVMLAEELGVPLILLHVVNSKTLENPMLVPHIISQRLNDDLPDSTAKITPIVTIGNIGKEIVKTAKEYKCQLIVMGVAHFDGIGEIITGTPVDKVVCESAVPVLIVKQRPKVAYKNLIVATDFSKCSHDAMLAAHKLLPDLPIRLMHIYHVPYEGMLRSEDTNTYVDQEARDLMNRFVSNAELGDEVFKNITTTVRVGEIEDLLQNHDLVGKYDLVVIGTHGRSGFIRSNMGFNTRRIMKNAVQDVLIARSS